MPQIINLSPIGEVLPGDSLPIFDESNGDTRRVSVGQLSTYMENTLSLPDNAADIDYDPAGTGAVQRSVQSKLRESVSVKDFGAVGDGVTDDTAAIQAAVTYLSSLGGGAVYFPHGTYKVTAQINIPAPVWTPFLISGNSRSQIVSTHNGKVFNDASGNVRFENLDFSGPGKTNVSAWAISSALGQGWVKGCKFSGYYYGVECSGSTSGLIERNRFALCHAGINCTRTAPEFNNIVSVLRNYFDFNIYGVFFTETYGLIFDSNAFEYNSVGASLNNVRELDMRGNNWFEANTTTGFELLGACTGSIAEQTHIVGNSYVVSSTSLIENRLNRANVLLRRSTTQSIPHNTATDITWDVETVDTGGMHAAASADVVIVRPGIYQVSACVQFADVATPGAGVIGRVAVKLNGATLREETCPMAANIATGISISFAESLSNGDILQVSVYQNQGVSVNINGGALTSFSVAFVSTV
jgi:hypothetical protein